MQAASFSHREGMKVLKFIEENTATTTEPTAVGLPTPTWDLDYKGFKGHICLGRYEYYVQLKGGKCFSVKLTDGIKAQIIEQAKQRLDK
jgi:hypothetical protein